MSIATPGIAGTPPVPGPAPSGPEASTPGASPAVSPFAANLLLAPAGAGEPVGLPEPHRLASPFAEPAGFRSESDLEARAMQQLLAELADEQFTEAVERLTQEGAARYSTALDRWAGEPDAPAAAAAETERWFEQLGDEVDRQLDVMAERYGARTVDSLGDSELDQLGDELVRTGRPGPLDQQDDFLAKFWGKVRTVAKRVGSLARKGVSALSRFLPMGHLLAAVRQVVRPLLHQVLARAIGRLPATLQAAARTLSGRLGISAEASSDHWFGDAAAEGTGDSEDLLSEFDQRLVGQLVGADPAGTAATAPGRPARQAGDPVAALDSARSTLAEHLAGAEPQDDLTPQLEQFLPAVLPVVRLGVRLAGRRRVIGLIAPLLAQLIKPLVGAGLAPALSRHIASSGLDLLGLETEEAGPRLGADAMVALLEDTARSVFENDPAVLDQDLLATAITHEAFLAAASRHLPARTMRPDVLDEDADRHGVWVMLPRRGPYRFRAYSQRIPLVLHRPVARQILLGEEETLEEHLLEAGVTAFPVRVDVEAFETLPGGERGHIAAHRLADGTVNAADLADELFELDDESRLNVLLPPPVAAQAPPGATRRDRGPTRRYVRVQVQGRPLRRRAPLSLRLDLTSARPVLTLRLRLGERRAHDLSTALRRGDHVGAVTVVQSWVRGPLRPAMARRLGQVLARHGVTAPAPALAAAADRLGDAVARAFAARAVAVAPELAAAVKDPQQGVTLTFSFAYPGRESLLKDEPALPAMAVAAGWRHG